MQKIDHSMIYALIAGTYTPICLITLRGGWGWSLFGTIWALAIGGIIWKSIGGMPEKLSLTLYIVMGWLAVIAFVPLINNMPPGALIWLLAGGLSYTIGSVIYAIENKFPRRKWFCLHDLWHIFVMTGSFCHFVMFFWYLI
jgi:hemolysin III